VRVGQALVGEQLLGRVENGGGRLLALALAQTLNLRVRRLTRIHSLYT